MSIHVHSLVYSRRFGSPTRKAVALKLADHASDDGTGIYPSLERVAAEVEVNIRTVRRTVRKFESEGILIVVRPGGNGRRDTREWRMSLQAVERLPVSFEKAGTVPPLSTKRRTLDTGKADSESQNGGHCAPQTIIEPSRNHARARMLVNGKWQIPKGTREFDAWHRRAEKLNDQRSVGECHYCPDHGSIERSTRWPP